MVLEPIDHNGIKNLNLKINKYKEIFEFLKELGTEIEMTFDEFLQKFKIDCSIYIMCLQVQLKRPQIFLKCKVSNICTNAFNKT